MTNDQMESLKRLKLGEITEINGIVVKKDRGQYLVTKGRTVRSFKDAEFKVMLSYIDDQLATTVRRDSRYSYEVPGTKLIVLKTENGSEVYQNGKLLQKGLSDKKLEIYIAQHKQALVEQKTDKLRQDIVKEHKITKSKKSLYYFILFLSTTLLVLTYVLGLNFNGVSITRDNQNVYDVISEIADEKYPEDRMGDYNRVYYTLNYWAHKQNYFMTPVTYTSYQLSETGLREPIQLESVTVVEKSAIFNYYKDIEELPNIHLTNSYRGSNFNLYFKNEENKYVPKDEVIRRIGYILGRSDIKTTLELKEYYTKVWDIGDVKSNIAYNKDALEADGTSSVDRTTNYYSNYLTRNSFIKLFLNHESNFIHEYYMFESIGWLTWTSIVLFILYVILSVCIWIFKKDSLKMSKALLVIIIILTAIMVVPLVLQYFFEGLSKDATQFLDILENTQFTTTTTLMNFVFDYIMKFSNIVLTGIFTIALPLKVIRYFVLNAVTKLDKGKKVSRVIGPGTMLSENIESASWRM